MNTNTCLNQFFIRTNSDYHSKSFNNFNFVYIYKLTVSKISSHLRQGFFCQILRVALKEQ